MCYGMKVCADTRDVMCSFVSDVPGADTGILYWRTTRKEEKHYFQLEKLVPVCRSSNIETLL